EQQAERASARGIGSRAAGLAASMAARAEVWADEERAIAVLADDERLRITLEPYQDGSLEPCPPWMTSELVGLLGPAVVSAALSRARATDTEIAGVGPYFDAIDVEVAHARGQLARALDLARETLDSLPRAEALVRARVAAVGAEAARRMGRMGESLSLFE